MRGLQVEVVPGTVKVRRHDRNEICAIMRPDDEISVAVLLKVAKQRTPYQTPVAGYIDRSKRHRTSLVQVICTGVKLSPSIPVRYPPCPLGEPFLPSLFIR